MLGLILFAASVWWGFSLLRLLGVRLRSEERIVAATLIGLVSGFWIVYVMARAFGGLSAWTFPFAVALFAFAALLARMRPAPPRTPVEPWFLSLAGVLLLVLLGWNLYAVLAGGPTDSVLAMEHAWADLPFHSAIITSFAYGRNFPPTYPMALGQPLAYPFLVDFVSAALLRFGLGLRESVVVVNVAVQLVFFCALALMTRRLSGSPRTAVLAVFLFFALGNFGFLAIGKDVAKAHGLLHWIGALPWSYTGDALGGPGRDRLGTGMYLGNPTFMFLVPRRSGALGIAAGATLLLLLDDLLEAPRLGTAVAAGIVIGLLPRVHGQTLIVIAIFLLLWFLAAPARKGLRRGPGWIEEWRHALVPFAVVGVVGLVIAVPELLAISRQAHGFFSWFPGWTGEPHDALVKLSGVHGGQKVAEAGTAFHTLLRFWVLNGGPLLLFAVPAFVWAPRTHRIFYAPFLAVWVFANLVRTQPWEWDNVNYFVYWQFGTVVLVAPWLSRLLFAETQPDGRPQPISRFVGGVLVFSVVFGGFLSFLYGSEHRFRLWSTREAAFAAHVRDVTPAHSVVLASNGHEHPVMALSGRQTYMGFTGWLSTQGLDWATFDKRLKAMYAGDVTLMRRLGIGYVVVGPWERGLANESGFTLPRVFDDPAVFPPVLDENIDGQDWKLLKLR